MAGRRDGKVRRSSRFGAGEARRSDQRSSPESEPMPAHRPTHQSTFQPTWTVERIELLKIHFQAGLSCREIAAEIGVSRNAVIGKLSRLNMTRDKAGREPIQTRGKPPKRQRREAVPKLRYQLLKALRAEPFSARKDEPIHNGHCCTLMELSKEHCRWPINT